MYFAVEQLYGNVPDSLLIAVTANAIWDLGVCASVVEINAYL